MTGARPPHWRRPGPRESRHVPVHDAGARAGPGREAAGKAPANAPAPVVEAIRTGSQRTGADFGYLLTTAQRESALDPDAKARSSSASGLFQFIEQTWLAW